MLNLGLKMPYSGVLRLKSEKKTIAIFEIRYLKVFRGTQFCANPKWKILGTKNSLSRHFRAEI